MQAGSPSTPAQRTEPTLLPPVDIVEDASGITLMADLPGVEQNDLSISVDGRTLTIDAPLRLGEANTLVSVYAEVRANHYRRSFELSGELDTTSVEAALKDGVLTLRLPKLERAKPRRIEVRTGS
ncbi:MAG: Hsp20/alpha crystallin family protein [Burkholderiales bacterium]|nr:Hsp20/alpha crystallin family protein [Burkholderiales bacterium]